MPPLSTISLAATAALLIGLTATTAATAQSQIQGTPTDIVTGLNVPWSVVRVGDDYLVSERETAAIHRFQPGQELELVREVPDVTPGGDGGLLGLAVLEEGETTWVYAYHTIGSANRIVRMTYADGALGEPEVIFEGLPGGRGHNGGRIAFGPDGMLYATVGDARNLDAPQDPAALGGKILRITPTGEVPADNPFEGSPVYSIGHRHPQGLTWDDNGQLWAAEFGNDVWDELNRIEPGGNYGWPVVEGQAGNPDFIDPVIQWGTQESGPSGIAYVDGTIYLAGLTGQRVIAVTIDENGNATGTPHFTGEYGRIRLVLEGPDDTLWFVTNNTDGRGDAPRPGDDRVLSVDLAAN